MEHQTDGNTAAGVKLTASKKLILGLQHTFAMFGATVLVPLLTGLDVSTTLLMAGLGTLLFHLITRGKVPAFLGSSFAFLGGYFLVAPEAGKDGLTRSELLPYACLGVACAGLVYLLLAALIKAVGITKVMRFFPPVVTGPIIISIGLILAPTAVNNCSTNWLLAIVALLVIIALNIWGRGMLKIIPIILGIVVSYIVAVCIGAVDFTPVKETAGQIGQGNLWGSLIGFPIVKESTILGVDFSNTSLIVSSIIAIVPIALATMMEHIGDISAISETTKKNFLRDPGLHRTLTGDGLATTFSALFGGPANTTYGENTGVLVLTGVHDPKVVRIAACFAVAISFFPIVSAVISTIPTAIIGGISFILYGMISSIGVRNVVENRVDFTKSRNLIIAAVIIVTALGINFSSSMGADTLAGQSGALSFTVGSATISLSGLAVAALAGIVLNAVLPGKDYVMKDEPSNTGVDFEL